MAPSGAPLVEKRGPGFGNQVNVSVYYFLLMDAFGLSVALIGTATLLGPINYIYFQVTGPSSVCGALSLYAGPH